MCPLLATSCLKFVTSIIISCQDFCYFKSGNLMEAQINYGTETISEYEISGVYEAGIMTFGLLHGVNPSH